MAEGYVYIFHNCEHVQPMVKIGKTTREVRTRAREIDATGTPAPFIPLFWLRVTDCGQVENLMHQRFEDMRIRSNREFFRVWPQTAIAALLEIGEEFVVQPEEEQREESTDMLAQLKTHYAGLIDSDLIAVTLELLGDEVYLTCDRSGSKSGAIETVDLSVIGWGKDRGYSQFFPRDISQARTMFMSLDPYTYIMTTPIFKPPSDQYIADVVEGRNVRLGMFDDLEKSKNLIRELSVRLQNGNENPTSIIEHLIASYA